MALNGRLNWGIIGTGSIASAFASAMERSAFGRVAAVGSRRQESADDFADRLGIARRHASYEALVADPGVDAVYIATPHPMHFANATLALRAGKPALVEKPFTMNAAEAQELVDVAQAEGLFLMEAMGTRFLPHTAEIRRLVSEGAMGEVITLIADYGQWFPSDASSRLFAPELGGGALLDLGVYPVSFASMVLGKPDKLKAMITPAFTGVDGQTSILLGYPSGAQAVLTCTSLAKSPTRVLIIGTEARIEVDDGSYSPSSFTLIPRRGEPVRFEATSPASGLACEAEEVARCLKEGLLESPVMPLSESIVVMEIMDAVVGGASH